MTALELIAFEREVADRFDRGEIRAPVHLSGGNEEQLIQIFRGVKRTDFVCSTWRSHYHALLHGIPPDAVMAQIMAGRSMDLNFPAHRFLTSAIVGGILPIACGLAYTGRRVWCFIGDMTAMGGMFHEATLYATRKTLPITFVIEDNGLSTNSPTQECWGNGGIKNIPRYYSYERTTQHVGTGAYVQF